MTPHEAEIRHRIASLVESVQDDHQRSQELFNYVWTMMCVKRGLLRVVREEGPGSRPLIILEEARTGRERIVARPRDLDPDLEGLAVQALAKILGTIKIAS